MFLNLHTAGICKLDSPTGRMEGCTPIYTPAVIKLLIFLRVKGVTQSRNDDVKGCWDEENGEGLTCSLPIPPPPPTFTRPPPISVCLCLFSVFDLSLCPTLHIKMPGPPVWYSEAGTRMPVSISSPRFSVKETKKSPLSVSRCLSPLNGSEIAGERGGGGAWRGGLGTEGE